MPCAKIAGTFSEGLSEERQVTDKFVQLHKSMLTVIGDISTGLWSRCAGVICHARGLG